MSPNASTVLLIRRFGKSSAVTSPPTAIAWPPDAMSEAKTSPRAPFALISSTTFCAFCSSRSETTTLAPSAAKSRAAERPMPARIRRAHVAPANPALPESAQGRKNRDATHQHR